MLWVHSTLSRGIIALIKCVGKHNLQKNRALEEKKALRQIL